MPSRNANNAKRVSLSLGVGAGKSRILMPTQEPGWLTAAEVMQILQVSERQVQRFQTEQVLSRLAYLERAGTKPLTLYAIDQVMEIKQKLDRKRKARDEAALVTKAAHERVRTLAAARRGDPLNIPADFSGGKTQAARAMIEAMMAHLSQAIHATVPVRDKLLLTVDEAQYFGFPRDFLYGAVKEKRLRNFGGPGKFLLARMELESMIAGGVMFPDGKVRGGLSEEEKEGLRKAS